MSITQKQKKWSILITMLVAVMFLIPGMAGAFGGKNHHGKGYGMGNNPDAECGIWRNRMLVQELGLNDEQVNKLKDMEYAHQEKQLALRSRIDSLQLQMDKALSSEAVEDGTVRDLAKKISNLRGEKYVNRVESNLSARKILTSDQIKKLDQYRMHHQGKGPGKGHGMGFGQGNPDCPRFQSDRNTGNRMN
ncbi:MAG: Spy/CpxP family protein refolding chaperone [Pseudomonadota bacterium]